MGMGVLFILQKWGRAHFSKWPNGWVFVYELSGSGFDFSCRYIFPPKRERLVKCWGRLLRECNLYMFVANFCVYKSKKYYNPRYIQIKQVLKSIYPNFWEKVWVKFEFEKYIYIYIRAFLVCFRNRQQDFPSRVTPYFSWL